MPPKQHSIMDQLSQLAADCEAAALEFDDPAIEALFVSFQRAIDRVDRSHSMSWIGDQAFLYLRDFVPRGPGDRFDASRGRHSYHTSGDWCDYESDVVERVIFELAKVSNIAVLEDLAKRSDQTFDRCKEIALPVVDALLEANPSPSVRSVRDEISKLQSFVSVRTFARAWAPQRVMTSDYRAVSLGGFGVPHHKALEARLESIRSRQDKLRDLSRLSSHLVKYFAARSALVPAHEANAPNTRILVGHGRSLEWLDLKRFLEDRLGLKVEEFNLTSAAGKATTQRLEEMLDKCGFAFLVMTAEDSLADGKLQARQNVVHEIGLCQAKYGFNRAIILLENGCAEFSNIEGLGQIRFPKGQIVAVSEEIRKVLERERVIPSPPAV